MVFSAYSDNYHRLNITGNGYATYLANKYQKPSFLIEKHYIIDTTEKYGKLKKEDDIHLCEILWDYIKDTDYLKVANLFDREERQDFNNKNLYCLMHYAIYKKLMESFKDKEGVIYEGEFGDTISIASIDNLTNLVKDTLRNVLNSFDDRIRELFVIDSDYGITTKTIKPFKHIDKEYIDIYGNKIELGDIALCGTMSLVVGMKDKNIYFADGQYTNSSDCVIIIEKADGSKTDLGEIRSLI